MLAAAQPLAIDGDMAQAPGAERTVGITSAPSARSRSVAEIERNT
jgi:hypothetical protein